QPAVNIPPSPCVGVDFHELDRAGADGMKPARFYASSADFRQRYGNRFHLYLICSNPQLVNKFSYGLEDLSIDVFLSSIRRLKLAFRHAQRMVATFNDV